MTDQELVLTRFFASSPANDYVLETLEIGDPLMTRSYHLWRETVAGTTTVGGVPRAMEPCNFEIKRAGSPGHLDQKFDLLVDTTDIQDTLRGEMDRVGKYPAEPVRVTVREFLKSDLASPQSTAVLKIENITYNHGSANISAVSRRLNVTGTGVTFNSQRFPMLRAFS
jgi:hypothetical protein